MADPVAPVVDPAPSPSTSVVDPAAAASAVAADPAKPAVTPPADPAKPADKPAEVPFTLTKYDFSKVEMPKGIELDNALIDAVTPVLLKGKVSQEMASELVAAQVKHLEAAEAKRDTDFAEYMKTTVANDQAALKRQLGPRYEVFVTTAQKGLARLTTVEGDFTAEERVEALRVLDETALGSKPWFMKIMNRAGLMVSEDKPPNGQRPAGTKSNAEVFYGASATPS